MIAKKGIVYEVKKNRVLVLMLAPAALYFLIFSYLPMTGVVLAFKRFTYNGGIFLSPWVGFDNFRYFFLSGDAFYVTRNTVLYNIAFIAANTICQIAIAIILSELASKLYVKITQSMMFLPYFISWVVVGAFVYNIFNFEYGALNSMLKWIGFPSVDVYSNVGAWKYIIAGFKVWKDIGYGSVIYLAAILGIEQEMYESADIDGANILQEIRHITLPCLMPTMVVLILLSIGNIFRGDFSMFYNIIGNNGMLYQATDVIDTYVFRSLMQVQEFGMASASGLYQSVLCFAIIMGVNALIKKFQEEYSLF